MGNKQSFHNNNVSPKEITSLLKPNDKGWDIGLFKHQKHIFHAICGNCNGICCDAVELGCDHDNSDIFTYCNGCLSELINLNFGKCPINNLHSSPIITPNRSIRRHILNAKVICVYSDEYKQKQNNSNLHILDTNKNDAENDNIKKLNGCNWNGTFNDLITKHLQICIQKYNPIFTQKLIINDLQNQNKILKDNNIELNNKLNMITIIMNESKSKIKQLTDRNIKLNTTLKDKNKQIYNYELKLNQLQKRIQILKNENANAISDDKQILDKWDVNYVHNSFKLNQNVVIKTENDFGSAFLSNIVSNGINRWSFKIKKYNHQYGSIFFGIWINNIQINNNHLKYWIGKYENTAYVFDGFWAKTNIHHQPDSWRQMNSFAEILTENSVVIMIVDFNLLSLSFNINGIDYGISHKIKKLKYRAAISTSRKDNEIELISYQHFN